jgi:hypothetical protein
VEAGRERNRDCLSHAGAIDRDARSDDPACVLPPLRCSVRSVAAMTDDLRPPITTTDTATS